MVIECYISVHVGGTKLANYRNGQVSKCPFCNHLDFDVMTATNHPSLFYSSPMLSPPPPPSAQARAQGQGTPASQRANLEHRLALQSTPIQAAATPMKTTPKKAKGVYHMNVNVIFHSLMCISFHLIIYRPANVFLGEYSYYWKEEKNSKKAKASVKHYLSGVEEEAEGTDGNGPRGGWGGNWGVEMIWLRSAYGWYWYCHLVHSKGFHQ